MLWRSHKTRPNILSLWRRTFGEDEAFPFYMCKSSGIFCSSVRISVFVPIELILNDAQFRRSANTQDC